MDLYDVKRDHLQWMQYYSGHQRADLTNTVLEKIDTPREFVYAKGVISLPFHTTGILIHVLHETVKIDYGDVFPLQKWDEMAPSQLLAAGAHPEEIVMLTDIVNVYKRFYFGQPTLSDKIRHARNNIFRKITSFKCTLFLLRYKIKKFFRID